MSRTVTMKAGETLISEGDASKCIYFIQAGMLEVYKTKLNERVKLGQISSGELVGEMSFIDQERRCATVICKTDCEIVEISDEKFKSFLDGQPLWWQALLKTLVARLRSTNRQIKI